ncbi:hypothetical protein M2146_001037 [Lachnospiraceae bacterium PF1-22]
MKHPLIKKGVGILLMGAVMASVIIPQVKDSYADSVADLSKVSITASVSGKVLKSFDGTNFEYDDKNVEEDLIIYASEDILDSNTGEVLVKKDAVAKEITAKAAPVAEEIELHKGTYYVKDKSPTKSGLPTFVKDKTKTFEVTGDGPQSIDIKGTAPATVDLKININQKLSKVGFDLFVAEEVKDSEGNMILAKDTKVGYAETDSAGVATLKELPANGAYGISYYALMTSVPKGYIQSEDKIVFDGKSTQEVTSVVEKKDVRIKVNENDNILKGVSYSVLDGLGTEVAKGTTDKVTSLGDLSVNETYTIYFSKVGYKPIEPVTFTVNRDAVQEVAVVAEKTVTLFSLKDIEDNAFIEGVNFEIVTADESVVAIESEKDVLEVKGLPIGTNTLRQMAANKGYVKILPLEFEVAEDGTATVDVFNERTLGYIEINLVTSVNREPIEGGKFILKNGDEKVAEVITNENGVAKTELLQIAKYEDGVMGDQIAYTIQQIETPDKYKLDSSDYQISLEYLDDETKTVYKKFTMPNVIKTGEEAKTVTVKKKVSNSGNAGQTGTATSAAATGDNARLGILMILVAGCVLLGMKVISIKRKSSK